MTQYIISASWSYFKYCTSTFLTSSTVEAIKTPIRTFNKTSIWAASVVIRIEMTKHCIRTGGSTFKNSSNQVCAAFGGKSVKVTIVALQKASVWIGAVGSEFKRM